MEKTLKINKIQGILLVVAGIVLISAMCFGVVFANFAITDKVANAEDAIASASNVPFVVGNSYRDVFFDTSLSVAEVDSILDTLDISGGNTYPLILLGDENYLGIYNLAGIGLGTGYLICDQDYFPIYSSIDITDDVSASSGWNIDESYSISDFQTCELVNNISFMSSQPFGSEPVPPPTYSDNLDGISVGDSAICVVPDLNFVGNEFYQNSDRVDFTIAKFSVSDVYDAYISVSGAGVAYKYTFGIYVNSLNPTYRVDLYWAGVENFGYYIDKNISLVYEGLTTEFFEMSVDAQEECYRFLNSLNFTSDVETVELYQDLLNRYDSLNERYNDILSLITYKKIIPTANGYIHPASYLSTYMADSFITDSLGFGALKINDTGSFDGPIGYIDFGQLLHAGTRLRIEYSFFGSVVTRGMGQSTLFGSGGIIGYLSDGVLHQLFISDDTNYRVNEDFNGSVVIDIVLPESVSRLYFYGDFDMLGFKNFSISTNDFNFDVALENAYQQGVDSVNVNSITQNAYNSGYYAGLSEQNPYTFRSLMGAVVDAPLDVFTQMFDFDILGVNMKGLYLSLFTLALVILVIKFALARG